MLRPLKAATGVRIPPRAPLKLCIINLVSNDREYMREYMSRRYYKRRAWAIELLGGKCGKCTATEDLQFHHQDRGQKKFEIGDALAGWAEHKLIEELKRFVVR